MGLHLLNTYVSHYTVEPTSSPTVLHTSHPTSNTALFSPAKLTLNDGIIRDSRSLTLVYIWGGIEYELLSGFVRSFANALQFHNDMTFLREDDVVL
jgi:hypothetical protein